MTKPTKPLDIYVRVSRVGGRENLISPEEQERRARALARDRKLDIGEVLTDLDQSGGTLDRPGLQRALERVRDGQSGGLIVAWLDRLSRDSEQAHALIRMIDEAGGAIYAPDAPSDFQTPEGRLQAGMIFLFASYIRQRARAGFADAQERAIMAGIPVGATKPAVGYRQRADRRLEPDPVAAPVIREVFTQRAAGARPSELCRLLTDAGIKTSKGSPSWSTEAVRFVLRNRIYLGELSYGQPPRFVNPDSHEPIVDIATWTAAQRPSTRPRPARGAGQHLLSGILYCAGCGYRMKPSRHSDGARDYRCPRLHPGGVCPSPGYARASRIEPVIMDAVRRVLVAAWEGIGDTVIPVDAGATVDGQHLAELQEAFESAQRRYEQALTPEVQDAAGDGWAVMVHERRVDRDARAAELGSARAARETRDVVVTPEERLAAWDAASIPGRRSTVAALLPAIAFQRADDDTPAALLLFPEGLPDRPVRGEPRTPPTLRPITTAAYILTLPPRSRAKA